MKSFVRGARVNYKVEPERNKNSLTRKSAVLFYDLKDRLLENRNASLKE
jgi:hypothetical protein